MSSRGAPALLVLLPAMLTPPGVRAQSDGMSYRDMAETMQMDDTARFAGVLLNQLEWRNTASGEPRAAWDAEAWYGGDYDKVWLKSEGGSATGVESAARNASVELLWNRVISPWWSLQAGARQDLAPSSRTWAALGVQGLAPQWLETEATLYLADEGRAAVRVKLQYELLLAQRLALQPFAEANLYTRADPQRQVGSGLSDLELSLRLRYEVRREIAPYVGVVWLRHFGGTAAQLLAAGESAGAVQLALGVRAAF